MEWEHHKVSTNFYRFRWVECQFKALQSCPCSEYHLDHLLGSLPQSLDETYERMLCNIEHFKDARRILTLLCFAQRPLTVQELIDGVAVEIDDSTGLNRKRRLQDSNGIRDICVGFIDIGLASDHTTETYREDKLTPTARIAHFSVQEYLESERIRHQKAAIFSLSSVTAHAEIAQICLTYLLEHGLSSSTLDCGLLEEFPLAHFAAMYWYHHYQNTANPTPRLDDLISRLFQHQDSFVTWVKLHDVDGLGDTSVNLSRGLDDIPTPVYYASLLGLDQVLHDLINNEQLERTTIPAPIPISTSNVSRKINAQCGYYGNALQAASSRGHDQVVQALVDKGADINARGGKYSGNALQPPSSIGYDHVVQTLIDKGADINSQGGYYGNALHAASLGGYNQVVKILLGKGANINAQGGEWRNALQAASLRGHDQVVQTLLDKGADTNSRGGDCGNALQMASFLGYDKVVRLLLNYDAVVNRKDIQGRNPFHLASVGGRMKIVETLSSFGSDPTIMDMQGRNCLHHAASGGCIEIVNWLLKEGFDPNYADRDGWTSLHWAAKNGSVSTIEVLKSAGARSSIEAIEGWTPDSVSIFHHKNTSAMSREDTHSELAAERNTGPPTAAIESIGDECKVSPGTMQHGCYCDGCLLVSFDLNNLLKFFV